MRFKKAILFGAVLAAGATGLSCKKGGGGGGGGWLVGSEGLMANVDVHGQLGNGYDLGSTETLYGIACRYQDEAWVVGANGTLLYTNDAGRSWSSQDLGTTADLHSLATQDDGPVFVVGNGVFFTATPQYQTGAAEWKNLGDGTTQFLSVAAAQHATTVLAVSADGGVWNYDNDQLSKVATLAGMRAVAISPDGGEAIAVGNGIQRSIDGGRTWSALSVDASLAFADVRISDDGDAVAVGAAGTIAHIDLEGRVLVQHVGTSNLKTVHIAEDADGYTATGYAAGEGGQIYMTTDGGWNWTVGPNVGRTVLGVDSIGDGHR